MSRGFEASPRQSMTGLRVHVHEMDCAEEAALLRRALDAIPAVGALEFDLIHGCVDILFDERLTTEAALLETIHSTGLHAHAVHGDAGAQLVAAEQRDETRRPRAPTVATTTGGAFFLMGWALESLTADHWWEVFVHPETHANDQRAVACYAAAAFAGLWPLWPRAWAAVRHLRLDMHALVCVTVLGAALIGEWSEGAAVALLFGLAHRMEAWSLERARREIAALVGRGPSLVAQRDSSSPAIVPTDQHLAVAAVERASTERWIERFAAVYTPAVSGLAIVVAVVPPLLDGGWAEWFYRALFFLVLACPCALVISTPVTLVAAQSAAARHGVLVRGAAVLERAARARTATRDGLAQAGVIVAGSRAANLKAADVVVDAADEYAMALLIRHSRQAMRVVKQNVTIALGTKLAFLAAAPFGAAPLWLAVLADTGATVIVTLNGLRLLRAQGRPV